MNRQKIITISILALVLVAIIVANVRAARAMKKANKVAKFQEELNTALTERLVDKPQPSQAPPAPAPAGAAAPQVPATTTQTAQQ